MTLLAKPVTGWTLPIQGFYQKELVIARSDLRDETIFFLHVEDCFTSLCERSSQ